MKRSCAALVLGLTVITTGTIGAAESREFQALLDPGRRDLVADTVSGERAKNHVVEISRFHRIQGSRGYRAAASYVIDQLKRRGYDGRHAWIESFPSDGKISYQGWQSPIGWTIDHAELRMLKPREERLAIYPDVPASVIPHSKPGKATAELVWVGEGTHATDYLGRDVRGKFVLATGPPGDVHRRAILERQAAGIVCYIADHRTLHHPDLIGYSGLWPRTEDLGRMSFGFSLTYRQGETLKRLLESGEQVLLSGYVTGRGYEPFFMDVVVATIEGEGRPEEELILIAHLDHPQPSANDNASGAAALLDIADSLNRLIEAGTLPRPKRTLRFLWVPEWQGTVAYLDAHPELLGPQQNGRALAGVNLDMVGENLEQLHAYMYITRTPDSVPSVLNDVVENVTQMVDRMDTVHAPAVPPNRARTGRLSALGGSDSVFNFRMAPFAANSDHMMLIDRKVPATMIGHIDYTHHTSADVPENVDPLQLERSEIVAAATMLFLASLSEREALDLTLLLGANAAARLGHAARDIVGWESQAHDGDPSQGLSRAWRALAQVVHRERETASSILTFYNSRSVAEAVARLKQEIDRQHVGLRREIELRFKLNGGANRTGSGVAHPRSDNRDQRIPVRRTRAPLDWDSPASRLALHQGFWNAAAGSKASREFRFELVNLVDGRRTVAEIADILASEFGPAKVRNVGPCLDELVVAGALRWK